MFSFLVLTTGFRGIRTTLQSEIRLRRSFETGIRRLIEERKFQLVAEEAGNDNDVAQALQRDEDAWAPLEGREPRRIEPIETIARIITRALKNCNYVDIRPTGIWPDPQIRAYEEAMLNAIVQNAVNVECILVLCGEFHRDSLSRALIGYGNTVEDHDFNWVRQM